MNFFLRKAYYYRLVVRNEVSSFSISESTVEKILVCCLRGTVVYCLLRRRGISIQVFDFDGSLPFRICYAISDGVSYISGLSSPDAILTNKFFIDCPIGRPLACFAKFFKVGSFLFEYAIRLPNGEAYIVPKTCLVLYLAKLSPLF